jgi:oxaloacetate decarboxylase alpha subunit
MPPIRLTDLVLRDAHQSLLATRMVTADMLPIAPQLDRVGYGSLETWGGATFDACIRFLNEDPWERLRALKKAMPRTPMQMLLRGQNLLGYRHYADDVVEAFVARAAANGVDVFRIFDALNDPRNLETAIRAARKAGKHAQAAISYATSPVHTLDAYVQLARTLAGLGADSLCLKDMAGLLKPYEAFTLVQALRRAVDLPILVHSHATTGMSVATLVKAAEAGATMLDTAISALAMGTSHSPTETIVEILRGTEYDTGLDTALLAEIAAYFRDVRRKYAPFESSFVGADPRILLSQVPGGMLSNLESQLAEAQAGDKLDAVLREIAVVQKDFGYPPLVTPTSQIVGTQAVFNVLFGRYERLTNESVDLLAGLYGATPAAPNADLVKQALAKRSMTARLEQRPADQIPNELGKIEAELKQKTGAAAVTPEDVLTYAMFPQVAPKFFQSRGRGPVSFPAPAAKASAPAPAPAAGPAEYIVQLDGRDYPVRCESGADGVTRVAVDGRAFDARVRPATTAAPAATPAPAPAPAAEGEALVRAPLPGVILKLVCRNDDRVEAGATVIVIEAMKMQMEIKTRRAGKVRYHAAVHDHVKAQAVLAEVT